MFKPKLIVSKLVLDKVRVASEIMGCTSPEEFAEKVLIAEANKVIATTSKKTVSDKEVEDITNQLKGLGYLE